jgi:hypothetical protein
MSYVKVSVWCVLALLLTTSVAMGGINDLFVTIGDDLSAHLGDMTLGHWSILNRGNSSMHNLSVYVFCTAGVYPNRFFSYIDEIKPMERIQGWLYAEAVLLGWNYWAVNVESGGESTAAASAGFNIVAPPPETPTTPGQESVPEFPTVVLPAIAVMGLIFLLQRRKGE